MYVTFTFQVTINIMYTMKLLNTTAWITYDITSLPHQKNSKKTFKILPNSQFENNSLKLYEYLWFKITVLLHSANFLFHSFDLIQENKTSAINLLLPQQNINTINKNDLLLRTYHWFLLSMHYCHCITKGYVWWLKLTRSKLTVHW